MSENRERQILFSGAMVRALLDESKTQTRRVLKFQEHGCLTGDCPHEMQFECTDALVAECPHGRPGDRLWVRETWAAPENGGGVVAYRADGECGAWMGDGEGGRVWIRHGGVMHKSVPPRDEAWRGQSFGLGKFGGKWRPSIFMPRGLSRLTLEITEVRVERVQDISGTDAIAEGVEVHLGRTDAERHASARVVYGNLWDSLNAKRGYSWKSNPWVWALTFKRTDT